MRAWNQRTRQWGEQFWAFAGAVSIRTKILGIVLGLVIVLGMVVLIVVRQSMQQAMVKELEARAVSVTIDLASRSIDVILVNNQYLLNQLIQETKSNHSEIRYIFVVDPEGGVLAHTFGSGFPLELLPANGLSSGETQQVRILDTTEGPVWDAAVPIFEGRAGTMRAGFSDALLRRTVDAVTAQLLLATLLVSAGGILAAIFLTWVLARPILRLSHAARAVGQGDLNQQVARWADDEIGELADSFNVMVNDLRQAAEARQERERLRGELVERVIAAQEDERKRIARDLHDQTSQSLVSLILQLKLVETAPDEPSRRKNIAALREQLREALGGVRQMALDLRPKVLDDLGLQQAIHWFADRCCQESGLNVNVMTNGDLDHLPARYAIAIYRVAQEALSNIVRHSHAKQAWVKLVRQDGNLRLEVRDNGKGYSAQNHQSGQAGLGIFGMRERVELLGGSFEIESSPGQGTRILIEIPMDPATHLEENLITIKPEIVS